VAQGKELAYTNPVAATTAGQGESKWSDMSDAMEIHDTAGQLADATVSDVPCAHCTLADARRGERFVVTEVMDAQARVTALRFGMAEGACVQCIERIPAGPIVLRSGRQEIAVGRELAKRIRVRGESHDEERRRTADEV
jgi:Fe2+ transport system protein FeoA